MHSGARPPVLLGRHMTEQTRVQPVSCLNVNALVFEVLFADVCCLLCYYIDIAYLLSNCMLFDVYTICQKIQEILFQVFLHVPDNYCTQFFNRRTILPKRKGFGISHGIKKTTGEV